MCWVWYNTSDKQHMPKTAVHSIQEDLIMSKIRVFSFNIWTDGRADGGASSDNPRCFAIRRELIKKNFPACRP